MKYAVIAIAVIVVALFVWFTSRRQPVPLLQATYDGPISDYKGGKTLLVAVHARWASVWRATAEALAKADQSRYDIKMIDADRNKQAVHDLGVNIVPTVLVFRDGKEIARLPNMMSLNQLP